MSVIVELCLFPVDKGDSLSEYVSRAVKIIQSSGLSYTSGPMGTTIEGTWDETMAVVSACYAALEKDCDRVYMVIKVDARKGRENGLQTKMQALQNTV